MPVLLNSNMIIPGPLLDIRREIVRNETGKIVRKFYSVQAKGKLMAWKGSPNSAGTFWTNSYTPGPVDENIPDTSRMAALRTKMLALSNLFYGAQGMWFEAQPFDGTASIKFQPRVKDIQFGQGLWFDTVDYTIDMEADTIYFGTQEMGANLEDVVPEESWSIEVADQIGRTYRLTHQVSSQQKDLYASDGGMPTGNNGWERARSVVLPYLGLDPTKMYASGVLNLNTNWGAFNYFRSQQIDEANGKFAVSETWLTYDSTQGTGQIMAPALDDFTINSRLTEEGITHVTVEGNITGLEVRDNSTYTLKQSRWESAIGYFNSIVYPNIFDRASSYSGLTLNPIELSLSIGRNPIQGTISWNAEYSDRRLPLIPNATHEEITLQNGGGTEVFAVIPVLGRPWGPVLQDINTITERTMSININAQMQSATVISPIQNAPNTDGIIASLAPVGLQVFTQRDESSWSPETGKYSRQVAFIYQ